MNHIFIGPKWEDLPPTVPLSMCGLRLDRLPEGDTVTRHDGKSALSASSDCPECIARGVYGLPGAQR